MPFFDVQEVLWLLSDARGGDVGRNYGYRDYETYRSSMPWAGRARPGYVVDWNRVERLAR
jgi:hypothetical protein